MPNLPKTIQTDRLYMRPYIETDAEQLSTLQSESTESLNKGYLGTLATRNPSKEDIATYIKGALKGWKSKEWIEYAVFEKETNRLIGGASFHHMDWDIPKGRIGYYISEKLTGHGYVTEIANILTRLAFDQLNLVRFELRAASKNPASNHIAKKLGYVLPGTLEKNKISVDGVLWDINVYARFDSKNLPNLNIRFNQ